jgi:hypothetical protein
MVLDEPNYCFDGESDKNFILAIMLQMIRCVCADASSSSSVRQAGRRKNLKLLPYINISLALNTSLSPCVSKRAQGHRISLLVTISSCKNDKEQGRGGLAIYIIAE